MSDPTTRDNAIDQPDMKLFWGCFLALIATSAAFIIRALIIDDWATDFNLTETQKGELFGVGLWPFAISIVLFSLIIDKIGYGKAMVFACLVGNHYHFCIRILGFVHRNLHRRTG